VAPQPVVTQQQILSVVRQELTQKSFSGPIPPPEALAQYEQITAGLAGRIVGMAESQLAHRQAMENMALPAKMAEARRGQWIAGAVAIVGLIVAGTVGVWGNAWASGAIGLADLSSIVGIFVIGSRLQRRELMGKAQAVTGVEQRS
jgi:uncharacterized membrane protein